MSKNGLNHDFYLFSKKEENDENKFVDTIDY